MRNLQLDLGTNNYTLDSYVIYGRQVTPVVQCTVTISDNLTISILTHGEEKSA
jgi:hypothetical protein